MKIKIFVLTFLLMLSIIFAHGEEDFDKAEELIKSRVSCNQLSDDELELLGDYYMEQMHPGEAHEMMDKMMGGEGSDSLKQVHIKMARRLYCNEDVGGMMGGGMMNMMMGNNMMGSGSIGMMDSGIMGNWRYGFGYWNFLNVLYIILLIGLIILVYFWIVKLWRDFYGKKK